MNQQAGGIPRESTEEMLDRLIRFPSIEAFYANDERRRRSGECDYGVWWYGQRRHPTYRVSWVRDTGELYAIDLHHGTVWLIGREDDEKTLEANLSVWSDHCGELNGLYWLLELMGDL